VTKPIEPNDELKRYAIFYPQFHQAKVNDVAWGYGFTDWVLVATANAFDYWKRRAPAVGYYDLSKSEVVSAQFYTAARSGLDGFGIYHYWFEDGLELGAVERYLSQSALPANFGYFFIWANESWSKRWAGKDTEILKYVSTSPSREQVSDHVQYLKPFMESASYTMVLSRPLFVIYRPEFFRDPVYTINCYRDEFNRAGLNPLIGYYLKSASDAGYSNIFDFCYLFEPRLFFNFSGLRKYHLIHSVFRGIIRSVDYSKAENWSEFAGKILNRGAKSHTFASFLRYYNSQERKNLIGSIKCPIQNVLLSGWNNAPRYRDRFTEVQVPNRAQFSAMLNTSLNDTSCSRNIPMLCNAWNEWSEGAAIEPCSYLGDQLLKYYLS
jgi:hypothetical protein